MSEMQGTLFEFDKDNELHRKAQHYIETMDREQFPAIGDLMVTAIVDYFDRYYGQDDQQQYISEPAFETEPEATDMDLDARIEAAVERALERKLPGILAPVLEGVSERTSEATSGQVVDDGASEEQEEIGGDHIDLGAVEKDINWGFLGG